MTKAVVLTEGNWLKIYNQIALDYPPSVLLIRDRMKEVLGFTVRRHGEWVRYDGWDHDYVPRHLYKELICLDFYNEPKRTMFLLKYGDFINEKPDYSYSMIE
jgi:hypothetical protein